ncbi:MAG: hypothetical protein FWC21_02970 [Treponema sp.]|nr:hypothetical protein [Treponema sp.]
MKNTFKIFGIIAMVAVIGFSMTGCVTATTIGGAAGGHGFFSGGGAREAVTQGATEIASYTIILGLFDSGYAQFADAVKQAESQGKLVTTTATSYFGFATKYTAFAR